MSWFDKGSRCVFGLSGALVVVVLAAAILAPGSWAQIQAGRIVGTVYDPARAVVPDRKSVV